MVAKVQNLVKVVRLYVVVTNISTWTHIESQNQLD